MHGNIMLLVDHTIEGKAQLPESQVVDKRKAFCHLLDQIEKYRARQRTQEHVLEDRTALRHAYAIQHSLQEPCEQAAVSCAAMIWSLKRTRPLGL